MPYDIRIPPETIMKITSIVEISNVSAESNIVIRYLVTTDAKNIIDGKFKEVNDRI
jgi:hypothetical protein